MVNIKFFFTFGRLYCFRRMLANFKLQLGQDAQAAIEETIAHYESVLTSNFQKREQKLIQQLFEEVKQKKKELAVFKKMLSQENIDRLISERRRDKEKERQHLESRWRECNQSFKTLQEEQKRLINEHKENLFDAKNLQQKIKEFEIVYAKLQDKVENMQQRQVKFMTETRDVYRSPYKREKTIDLNETICSQKIQKLNQSHTAFFSNKYSLNKQIFSTELKNSDVLNQLAKTIKHPKPKIKTLNVNCPKIHPQKCVQNESQKQELFKFLLNPKIKQKIFEIINREL